MAQELRENLAHKAVFRLLFVCFRLLFASQSHQLWAKIFIFSQTSKLCFMHKKLKHFQKPHQELKALPDIRN